MESMMVRGSDGGRRIGGRYKEEAKVDGDDVHTQLRLRLRVRLPLPIPLPLPVGRGPPMPTPKAIGLGSIYVDLALSAS